MIRHWILNSQVFLPSLFNSFSRERNTTDGKVAGTGLGMSIVKELVDLMDGTIEVESELGKGTRFTVILEHRIADEKYYEQKAEQTLADRKEILQGKYILLAEDNELNAEIAITILEDMGLKIDWVEDGMNEHIAKPIDVEKVEEVLISIFELRAGGK